LLVKKKYTDPVALAGKTAGGIGFTLIFLLTFFIKKKSKKESYKYDSLLSKKNLMALSYVSIKKD